MKLVFSFLVVLCIFVQNAYAQAQVQWTQSNVQSATQAQSFTYKLYVTPPGQGVLSPIVLNNTLCGSSIPNVQCATALPATANQALITGSKSELTATDPTTGNESPKSAPFFPQAAAPINLQITP